MMSKMTTAQHQGPRPRSYIPRVESLASSFFRARESCQVRCELFIADPAQQVKLDGFESSLRRLRSRTDGDQQADDQGRIHLQCNAIGVMRYQVLGAQHALQ